MRAARTIFALSSAPGRAAISVIRVSGPHAREALRHLTEGAHWGEGRAMRVATLRRAGRVIDRAFCLWMPGPATATGEDVAEFHVHGGPAVVRGVLDALASLEGFRLAEPGEFTRRAFYHGKLDLTQAEGLADLIDAETERQADQALMQMQGGLGQQYETWRTRIVRALAYTEAVIDFPDEDVPDSAAKAIEPDLKSVISEIEEHLSDNHRGEILREGLNVAIIGPPNAGKSSLLNALAQRDVAIVSHIAGTTRDVLEIRLNVQGFAVNVADTAGLRDSTDQIESEGIRRALDRAKRAQVRILLIDPDSIGEFEALQSYLEAGDLVCWSKGDLDWDPPPTAFQALAISTTTGAGLAALLNWLGLSAERLAGTGGAPVISRARHREALSETVSALQGGLRVLDYGLDRAAEHLRLATAALGRITGRVDVEDVLDVVFRDFCIGK